jgi:plasmid stabilization system protein ParE
VKYQLQVLDRAQADIDSIFQWLHERSPIGAARWYEALGNACFDVTKEPLRFPIAPESDATGALIREFLFQTRRGRRYRGLFIVVENEVRLLRVRGPGQPPAEIEAL